MYQSACSTCLPPVAHSGSPECGDDRRGAARGAHVSHTAYWTHRTRVLALEPTARRRARPRRLGTAPGDCPETSRHLLWSRRR